MVFRKFIPLLFFSTFALAQDDLAFQVKLIKELMPDATRVGLLFNPTTDVDSMIMRAIQETGIKVNYIEAGGDSLIERISQEAEASPADIFITADAGILWRADQRDVFRAVANPALEERVPAQYRHPEGKWFGLSKRARIVIYNKEQGLPEGLETYEDLADPAYRGMICVRSSSNIYNQSLLASIIAHNGAEAAEAWAAGVVANFARKPQGNDTSQIEAVAAGICRLGIVTQRALSAPMMRQPLRSVKSSICSSPIRMAAAPM